MQLRVTKIEDVSAGTRLNFDVGVENTSSKEAPQLHWLILVANAEVTSAAMNDANFSVRSETLPGPIVGSSFQRFE
jgi:hypothetical protein